MPSAGQDARPVTRLRPALLLQDVLKKQDGGCPEIPVRPVILGHSCLGENHSETVMNGFIFSQCYEMLQLC